MAVTRRLLATKARSEPSAPGIGIDDADKLNFNGGMQEDVSNLGNLTGTATIDLSVANFFYGTVTGDVTISFTNPPSTGNVQAFILEFTNPGAHTITWPAGAKWPGGALPSFTAAGVDIIAGYTRDGGTTYRLSGPQLDSKAVA